MTTTSPNQEGVEGTECEEVWMITGESVILFTYASFVRNPFILPHQEGIFLGWLARDYTSLRNSWDQQDGKRKSIASDHQLEFSEAGMQGALDRGDGHLDTKSINQNGP